ncbi:MAG: DUF3857 domain-containing protein [Hyphomonadaceae bacterium]|nr:DUF3857 domain-containing protein [Hyphomonadaceae bacterium]
MTRAPVPDWVELEPYARPTQANPHFIANGLSALLDEVQIDLCGAERGWFHRRADLVTAHAGAEHAAQFNASIDPAFERLEIHSVRVLRGERVIDYTNAEGFQALRREQNLERLIYDGRITVHFAIPDVRPGDIVETAITMYGMRKSLGGRHAAWMLFEWGVGVVDLRVRQRSPKSRIIHERRVNTPPTPVVSERDGIVDKRWRALERPAVRGEALAPPWTVQGAAIQFSEWRDWSEVIAAFAPLYEEDAQLPPDLEEEIARIAESEPSPEGRAAAALQFTQSAIRYLAISVGEGGYTPRPLADIWATRYGDCKDKSKLFVAIAKRLGFEACPALVDTRGGYGLGDLLPTAQAFDHCIVKATISGAAYWLDPTRARQLSPLAALSQCHLGWALPLADGATLERMPDPSPVHSLETRERITLGATLDDRVRYEWRATSRRGRAEWVRETIAREGAVGMFKLYAQDIQRTFPLAEPIRQDIEQDDITRNEVTVVEAYDLPQAWSHLEQQTHQFSTLDLTMKSQLAPIPAGTPRHPVYLGQIGTVSRSVEIDAAHDLNIQPWTRRIESSALVLEISLKRLGSRSGLLEEKLEFRALTLPPSEADKYRAIVGELDKSDIAIRSAVNKRGVFVGAKTENDGRSWVFNLIWIGVVVLYLIWRAAQ